MANPKLVEINKHISLLHLLPQPETFYTFAYPVAEIPSLVSGLYARYPFFSVTRDTDLVSVAVGFTAPRQQGEGNDEAAAAAGAAAAVAEGQDLDGAFVVDGEVRGIEELGEAERWYGPWRAIKVRGPLFLGLTGILNELTTPLRKAEIGIYAISTWPTDYVFVPAAKLDESLKLLSDDGWTIVRPKVEYGARYPL